MAARVLRHVAVAPAGGTVTEIVAAPVAGRAIVGRAIIANVSSGTLSFNFYVAGSQIAGNVALGPGEVYEQLGMVLVATKNFTALHNGAANTCVVTFMGEEVDN